MEYGVGEVRRDQRAARECYIAMLEMDDHFQVLNIEEQWVTVEPTEALEEIPLDDNCPDWITRNGSQASPLVCKELTLFLRNNLDVFTWSLEDMPGIDPSTMVHQLNVSPSFLPVWQMKKVSSQERDKTIVEEVHKLLDVGLIREVYYLEWLANIMMVRKSKWQVEDVSGLHWTK